MDETARILIAEDELTFARTISESLAHLGYRAVKIIDTGEKAVQETQEFNPDLVLMDITLGGAIDGIQAAEQIQMHLDIPVVYITGNSTGELPQRVKNTDPFGYLLKPFGIQQLQSTIELALYKHKMERKLRENEAKLTSTLKSIGDGIITTDIDGLITFINPAAEQLTGRSHAGAIGQPIDRLYRVVLEGTDTPANNPALDAINLGRGVTATADKELIRPDGTKISVDDSGAPIITETGEIIGAVLTIHDVTDRRQMERTLEYSEERFRTIVENAPLMIKAYDADQRCVLWNKRLEEVTGLSKQETLYQTNVLKRMYTDPAVRHEVSARLQRADGTFREVTSRFAGRQQQTHMWAGFRLPDDTTISMGYDVTQRRKAEAYVRENEEQIRLLLHDMHVGVILYTANAEIRMCNLKAVELLELDQRNIEGKGYEQIGLKFVYEDGTPVPSQAHPVMQVIATQKPVRDVVLGVQRKHQVSPIWLLVNAEPQFSDGDELGQILCTLSDITNRVKMEDELKRRNNELSLLNRASQVFVSTQDLDSVLTTVLEEIRTRLDVLACSAWLVDLKQEELVCRQVTGPRSSAVRGWRLPLGQGIVGATAANGESIIVHDTRTDSRHYRGVDDRTRLPLRSILSVPLRIKEKVIGVLQVVDSAVERFSPADRQLVESLAATAAIAIENARLYEVTDQLRAFNEKIVQSVEEGILILDPERNITFINTSGARLLGHRPEQMVGQDIINFIHPDEQQRVISEFDSRASSVSNKYETVMLSRHGYEISVIVSAKPVFDEEQFVGVLCVFMDITRRKKSDEMLRKLMSAVEQAADHMFITNKKGVIEYVNSAFQRLTGYSGKEIVGKTPRILKSGHHTESFYREMWNTLEDGQVFRGEFVNRKKNGDFYYEEQTITPIRDNHGIVTHYVATGRDITERKITQQALEQAVERFQQRNRELDALIRAGRKLSSSLDLDEVLTTILEEATDLLGGTASSIWVTQQDTATGEPVLVCRQAIGPQREQVQGWQLAPGEGVAGWVAQAGTSLMVPDILADERHYAAVDKYTGVALRALLSVPLKRVNQGVIGVLHILDDTPERFTQADLILVESFAATASIALENAQLYEQAQQNAKTKAVLLDEINHRVKNNLSAIIGLLFAVESRVEIQNNLTCQAIIKDLVNRVQGLAAAHTLLSASEWAPLLLSQLVDQVIHSALQLLPINDQVTVLVTPSRVKVTPAQSHYLALVINELTTNTVKHGVSSLSIPGQISVVISQTADADRSLITLEFRDNGPGFPPGIIRQERDDYSIGFDLIKNIVEKSLRGTLTLYNDDGAVALIQFNAAVPAD